MDIRPQELGIDHPDTLSSQNLLAFAYEEAGLLHEAIPVYERTLEARRVKLGVDHPSTLMSLTKLAVVYERVGRMSEAIPLYEAAVHGSREKLGDLHPRTHRYRWNLADAYETANRHADVERVAREMVEAAGKREPRDDEAYAESLLLFGRNLIPQRRFADAVPPLSESLKINELVEPDIWTTAETRSLLGEALAGVGQLDEAEPLLLEGQRGLVERADAIPARIRERVERESVARLVALYEAWNKPEQAARWRRKLPADAPGPGGSHQLPADPFARAGGRSDAP